MTNIRKKKEFYDSKKEEENTSTFFLGSSVIKYNKKEGYTTTAEDECFCPKCDKKMVYNKGKNVYFCKRCHLSISKQEKYTPPAEDSELFTCSECGGKMIRTPRTREYSCSECGLVTHGDIASEEETPAGSSAAPIYQQLNERPDSKILLTKNTEVTSEESLKKLFEDLRIEVKTLLNLRRSLSDKDLSRNLGRKPTFIQTKKAQIKKNPEFLLSLEDLSGFQKSLNSKFGESAKRCSDCINEFIKANPGLKEYSHQQYNIKNPHFFRIENMLLDTDEGDAACYFYGFFHADGYLKSRYKIGFRIHSKDELILKKLCDKIGCDYSKIKINENVAQLEFRCKPMAKELINVKKHCIPEFLKSNKKKKLIWLYGFYDGDGTQGRTLVGTVSKPLLEEIKSSFHIKNKVNQKIEKYTYIDKDGKIHTRNDFFHLSIGPEVFNKMLLAYSSGGLPRKATFKQEKDQSYKRLVKNIDILEERMGSSLQEMVLKYRVSQLRTMLGSRSKSLHRLFLERGIILPPKSFWINKFTIWPDKRLYKDLVDNPLHNL